MNSVSKTDPSITELTKRVKELESNLENVNKEKEELFNTFHSLNLLTKNTNALYTINDFDIKCKFNYVSPSVTKLAGYEPEELIGKSAFDFVHPKDRKTIVMPLMKTYLEYQAKKIIMGELRDRSKTFHYRCLDKSGGWRYVETTSNLVGNQLIMVTIDIGEQKDWEKRLEHTKVDYKNLLDNLEDIYFRLNKDGIITDINPAITKVSGFKQSEIIGKDVRNFFTDNEQRHGFIDSIKKKGVLKNYELDFIVKDGSKVYVSANAYIIKDDSGEPIGIEGILRNNTDWKLAETALVESEKNTKFLADSALELLECKTLKEITSYSINKLYEIIDREGIVFIVDYDYATELWEMQEFVGLKPYAKKLADILGFDISKMKGNFKTKYNLQKGKLIKFDDSLTEMTRGLVPKKFNNVVMRLISMDSLYCVPFQKNNEVQGNVTIITNSKTKPINKLLIEAFISQVSTFYENIKIDKELSESKERYKALYDSSTQAIAIANDKGQLLEANPEFLKLFKINDIDQLRKLNPTQISPEYQPNGELSSKLIASNMVNTLKKRFTRANWIHKKLDGTEFPTTIEITKFSQDGEIFFQTSIIDLTNQIKAEEKYRDLVEKADIAILVDDIDGQFVYYNDKFPALYDYTSTEIRSKLRRDLVHPDDINLVRENHSRRINGEDVKTDYDFRAIKKDGSIINLRIKVNAIEKYGKIIGTRSYIWDITEKIKAQDELKESREKYQDLYDNAPDMYFSVSPQGIVLSVNDFGAKCLGYKKGELIGESVWIVVHPDDLKSVQTQIGKILKEKTASSEMEFRKIKKDGTVLHVQERLQCLVDENNNSIELRINCRDITESKITQNRIIDYQRNLKSLSNALIVAEEKERKRLAITLHDTVGQLLAMTNIKLSTLGNNTNNTNEIDEVKNLVSEAIKESRNLTYELSPPILHELGLYAACKWYVDQLINQHNIKINISGNEHRYKTNEEIQILMYRITRELLNNIIKHSEASIAHLIINKSNNYIEVIVQDDGVGFDANKLREISIEGKKFGLFSITERIEYLGGSFDINSVKGKGTKITIKVPI